jgi:hypothetical protein
VTGQRADSPGRHLIGKTLFKRSGLTYVLYVIRIECGDPKVSYSLGVVMDARKLCVLEAALVNAWKRSKHRRIRFAHE